MNFEETEKQIDETDIAELESLIGRPLPLQLRHHYLKHNGGMPEKYLFFADNGQVYGVHEFFSIKYGDSTISKMYDITKSRIPNHLICFATDDGGNDFCISTRDSDYGSIYFFDHEFEDDPGRVLTFLSPSFESFLKGLSEEEDDHW